MRNILEYPITYEEKIEVLKLCQTLLREHVGNRFGGVEEYALQQAIEDVHRLEDLKH